MKTHTCVYSVIIAGAVLLNTHSFGNDLCRKFIENFKDSPAETIVKIDAIINYITSSSGIKPCDIKDCSHENSSHEEAYMLLVTNLTEGATRHDNLKYSVDGKTHDSFENINWVITLPEKNQETIWSNLTNSERQDLVIRLQQLYRQGTYHFEITTMQNPIQAILNLASSARVDLSPRAALHAASFGSFVGVCRHSNCAFAGNLLELGVPPDNIKLVTGYNETNRHLWLSLRLSDAMPWREYDATASFGPALSFLNSETTADQGSLSEKYPKSQREVLDFHVPVKSNPYKSLSLFQKLKYFLRVGSK